MRKKTPKAKNVNARFDEKEHKALHKMAESKDVYVSSLVAHIVVTSLKRNGFLK